MVTETQERFDDALNSFSHKMKKSQLVYDDAFILLNLAQNMAIHYGQVRTSRERWKAKYYELKSSHPKDKAKSEVKDAN